MDQQGYAIEQETENRILSQLVFEERLSFLSPAATMRLIMDQLAGTDATRHVHFRSQVEAFRIEWRRFFLPKFLHDETMNVSDYEEMPWFIYKERTHNDNIRGINILLLWNIVFLIGYILALKAKNK